MTKNIGLNVSAPEKTCDDVKCPFHGKLKVRGKIIIGVVASDKMKNSIVVRKDYLHYVRKYMRYEKRRSKILAHNPPCIEAKQGDIVKIAECKPISKNISFVVVEKIKR
ncbi:30S ribosomal protein S17 [Candidatus Bathyarchaeota archaeon]|nr:30S ribosomal protein S17 [Candidatus Bathyarchaeota archaeon]